MSQINTETETIKILEAQMQVFSSPKTALIAFLRHTNSTLAEGSNGKVADYTFVIAAPASYAKRFVDSMRTELSRMRDRARNHNMKYTHFRMQLMHVKPSEYFDDRSLVCLRRVERGGGSLTDVEKQLLQELNDGPF